jgi:hypothetical protein
MTLWGGGPNVLKELSKMQQQAASSSRLVCVFKRCTGLLHRLKRLQKCIFERRKGKNSVDRTA